MHRRAHEEGYTLIELLVVIGILAVVASLAGPVASHVIRASEAHSDAYRVITMFRQIQFDAANQQQTIAIAPSTAGIDISTGQTLDLSSAATIHLSAPLYYYPDGTASGGRLILHNDNIETDIDVAWLTGAIHAEGAP